LKHYQKQTARRTGEKEQTMEKYFVYNEAGDLIEIVEANSFAEVQEYLYVIYGDDAVNLTIEK
jgi:hypothetical protein